MKKTLTILLAFSISAASASFAAPDTEEVIAKARAHLGGDEALDRIESIRYSGAFETNEGGALEMTIIFQKPMRHRVEVDRGELIEVSVLDDMDGWRKVFDPADERRWSVDFLDAREIRELQATTWENLHFFKNIEQRRGKIENEGIVEFDGQEAVKLVFRHPRDITFTRYFDSETGELLVTETFNGSEIREYGEMEVNGVRFPERIVMSRDGEKINEIRFTEIAVNQEMDDGLFATPRMSP